MLLDSLITFASRNILILQLLRFNVGKDRDDSHVKKLQKKINYWQSDTVHVDNRNSIVRE